MFTFAVTSTSRARAVHICLYDRALCSARPKTAWWWVQGLKGYRRAGFDHIPLCKHCLKVLSKLNAEVVNRQGRVQGYASRRAAERSGD